MNFPLDVDHSVAAISLNEYCSFELQTALSRSSALPGVCPYLMWLVKRLRCCAVCYKQDKHMSLPVPKIKSDCPKFNFEMQLMFLGSGGS